MIELFSQASSNFATHQLQTTCSVSEHKSDLRTVVAYIDIDVEGGEHYRVNVAYSKALLGLICELYLGEEECDDEALNEMALETTNMLIGSAKTLASESGSAHFTIATPHLCDCHELDVSSNDQAITLLIGEHPLVLSIEEL